MLASFGLRCLVRNAPVPDVCGHVRTFAIRNAANTPARQATAMCAIADVMSCSSVNVPPPARPTTAEVPNVPRAPAETRDQEQWPLRCDGGVSGKESIARPMMLAARVPGGTLGMRLSSVRPNHQGSSAPRLAPIAIATIDFHMYLPWRFATWTGFACSYARPNGTRA